MKHIEQEKVTAAIEVLDYLIDIEIDHIRNLSPQKAVKLKNLDKLLDVKQMINETP